MTEVDVEPAPQFVLRAIYVRDSVGKLEDGFDPLVPGQQLLGQFTAHPLGYVTSFESQDPAVEPLTKSCSFLTRFEFYYRHQPDGVQPSEADVPKLKLAATIVATVAADYIIEDGAPAPKPDALQRWGQSSAVMHTWPYWREFCSTTMLRMNLPVTLAPLMVVGSKREQAVPKETVKPPPRKSRKRVS